MSGQSEVLPVGSLHSVWVQVTDSPLGEATLEHVTVSVAEAVAPIACDRGPNGTVVLVPGRTVMCRTQIRAEAGPQSFTVQATGVVAGSDDTLVRNVVVSYQGSVPAKPIPVPAAPLARATVTRSPSSSSFGGGTPWSTALPGACTSPAPGVVSSPACSSSVTSSTACTPMPSPSAGSMPHPQGECTQTTPTTSSSAECATRAAKPAVAGSADCAKADSRGALAFTGAQVILWGTVAMAAVAFGAGLLLRYRRIGRY
jgi:hypothetical protein